MNLDRIINDTRTIADPERLTAEQLRVVLDYIYDGVPQTIDILLYLHHSYKRGHRMMMWCMINGIRGKKFLEFFQNESGDIDGGGRLSGVCYILGKIDGVKYRTIKAKELR